jgi:sialate O-acetylesterase
MELPTAWENAGLPDYDGVAWFRKSFSLPKQWASAAATLELGPIDDRDTTWVNGVKVGATDEWNRARSYSVGAGTLRDGKNVIAVRVLDTGGNGGICGQADQMSLRLSGASAPIVPLAGTWSYKASVPLSKTTPLPQQMGNNPNVVTVLYNGMIAPLIPYGIKGAIWYQGESNAGRAVQYRTLLPTMIKDWRSRFGVGDFPFFIVQLANFMDVQQQPVEPGWADLREAQLLTAQHDPNVGLAVAIDIGEANDIHPRNKQEVGRRLALSALGIAYKKELVSSGPELAQAEFRDGRAYLRFKHVGAGLVAAGGGPLKGFAIAGEDKQFVWGEATIDGDTVIVSAPSVSAPAAVRYGWANNPTCNLANQAGLPASPFRTDVDPQ